MNRPLSKRALSPIVVMLILFMVMTISATVVWWYYNAILQGSVQTAQAASLGVLSRMEENMSYIGLMEISEANGSEVVYFNGSVLYASKVICLDADCNTSYVPPPI